MQFQDGNIISSYMYYNYDCKGTIIKSYYILFLMLYINVKFFSYVRSIAARWCPNVKTWHEKLSVNSAMEGSNEDLIPGIAFNNLTCQGSLGLPVWYLHGVGDALLATLGPDGHYIYV